MTDLFNKESIPIVIAINVVKLKMEISGKAVLSNTGDKTQWTLLYYWNFADKWLFLRPSILCIPENCIQAATMCADVSLSWKSLNAL